ncbi:MAG: hypothetical protein A2X94_10980 [Bdellovibrionales bacterium GWB1_55_8]|nr:MAG: hypothetical protein A2X94_10980 [Bdellovibrionales bacterium GWB1_55_8]
MQQSKIENSPLPISQPNGFPGLPSGWITEQENYSCSTGAHSIGALLFRRENWSNSRALVILHGMGEHGGRYLHVPHFLQSQVSAVFCPDKQGHGRSTGVRGHVRNFDDLADDAALAVRRLHERLMKQFGTSEIHVLGHSLGGHVAIRMARKYPDLPIRSLTVSAPFLGLRDVPAVKKAAALALSRVWGSLPLDTGLAVEKLSRDPAVVKHYSDDPMNHGKMTPRFFRELLAAFDDTMNNRAGLHVPLLILLPTGDQVVNGEKTTLFFHALEHRDKLLKTYPGFFHESLNELGKEQVFADIAAWIQSH